MRLPKMLFAVPVLLAFSPVLAQTARTYANPIPYCKAVGTIDKPDARYTGPKLPAWMAGKLNMQPDQGELMEWRCANGAVLACQYGANIPCDSKAMASKEPTQAIIDYCRQNADSQFVPMYVTGHDTSVSWACHGSRPVVIHSAEVDQQGYQKDYWHKVSP
jgi:hypothetical protein